MSAGLAYFNIEQLTLDNTFFRHVISTTEYNQIVLMSLEAGEQIGFEQHPHLTQFIRIESGQGLALIGHEPNIIQYPLYNGMSLNIPPHTYHNIINNGVEPLKLYTIYSGDSRDFHPTNLIEQEPSSAE